MQTRSVSSRPGLNSVYYRLVQIMEWVIIVVLCIVLIPVVYKVLKGTLSFLAKLALFIVAVAIVGLVAFYLIQ